ncbi:MAG TPA: hypothetical protein VE842_06540 [Pyrinomonadaceae bacterium]|nr:hypothetical protein [Pyrinomonadaceae bacterium]
MADVTRVQFELDDDQIAELEELRELGGLRTKKDLLNNAITLLKWAAKEEARGASIFAVNEASGTYKELEMPFLETYASNVRRKTHQAAATPSAAANKIAAAKRKAAASGVRVVPQRLAKRA